ncbi:hypothetical protein [Flavimaricola marinus]|uniref:Uncharacterized protein n=1 Tax=Flavimaricola marinus TaxID=1819565 RepID=A0A238LKY4_9RHOB|nr:hypothetical protein [Flavimaricola marinus]SMY10193.1 hypothetical protein LOM8899_04368 [Flavimaricola marinus]
MPQYFSGRVFVRGHDKYPHALRRLRASFPEIEWVDGSGDGPCLTLQTDNKRPEGSYRIERSEMSLTVTGGPFSGVIFGVEELIALGGSHPGRLRLPDADIDESPGLAYRTFWTWDHSTNWEISQIGQQEIGVFNPYGKPPGGFLADYQRCVDFCSQNKISAIVIYGFLRDSHGGIESAQELCRYATERGVRIIPGIAIGSYGGVYWEGDSPWNLATWLKDNPQHAATLERGVGFQIADLAFPLNFPKSDYTLSACPSAPETIRWMSDGVAWLSETFDIGGINIEAGDYGVCGCERCTLRRDNPQEAARRADTFGDYWSHTDMAENFPILYERAKSIKPDLWIYSEIQWDNLLDPVAHEAQKKLPKGGIYQHTTNRSYWSRIQSELTGDYVRALPMQPNVLRCQFACQWNGDERTERYAFNGRAFADMTALSHQTGMRGLTVWGEPSPYHATVEFSYLAFARFSWSPDLSWDDFIKRDMAPRLGGLDAAKAFVEIAEELDAYQVMDPDRLTILRMRAAEHRASDESGRRWLSLEDQISRRLYMGA